MNIGKLVEEANRCKGCLSSQATSESRRRQPKRDGETLDVKNPWIADRAKILGSKAFRLSAYKTQVVTAPIDPYIRTRQAHVQEVAATSDILADVLSLNTDLTIAIALGHDIGHVPLGHQGEKFLKEAMGKKNFCHEIMGPIIAQKIERGGNGLNLTHQTLEGMMCHSGDTAKEGMTQEAWVVRYADKITYLFHDYNDIERLQFPVRTELTQLMNEFGSTQRERATTAMSGLIIESHACGKVSFEKSDIAQKFSTLRRLMYEVYGKITLQDVWPILEPILNFLEKFIPRKHYLLLSLMTDRDVLYLADQKMLNVGHINQTAIKSLIPHLDAIGEVDMCDPDLNW